MGYLVLIAASGLWFRVRFVWFMTTLSLASYGFLVYQYYRGRPEDLRDTFGTGPDRVVAFVDFTLAMIGVALVVGYLVSRVRALSGTTGRSCREGGECLVGDAHHTVGYCRLMRRQECSPTDKNPPF